MGCATSARNTELGGLRRRHDVCVTSLKTVESTEDFAGLFTVWIMRVCKDLNLAAMPGRPNLGGVEPKPGSKEEEPLRLALLNCRVAVCIMNLTPGITAMPPGYTAEMSWAEEKNIPVVPFYDADHVGWKELCTWRSSFPNVFRSNIGPVKYRRKAHDESKKQLEAALKDALDEAKDSAEVEGTAALLSRMEKASATVDAEGPSELSKAEKKLREAKAAGLAMTPQDDGDGLADEALGFDRKAFERAGLVETRLERTNSLRDINVDSALALLAKRAAGSAANGEAITGPTDVLAARDGGCRLQFVNSQMPPDLKALGSEPKHRVLQPVKGILKRKGDKPQIEKHGALLSSMSVKQLRLSGDSSADRRFRFSVQTLQQHLDGILPNDVHELMTVLGCLRDGVDENALVVRALRLLSGFAEQHLSLHERAIDQGAVQAVIAAMRRHSEVDVLTTGAAVLASFLSSGCRGADGLSSSNVEIEVRSAGGDVVTAVSRSGGIEVITFSMRRFYACELLQQRCCRCLGLLARGSEANRVSGYRRGKHAESSVMLRSQARRLVSRHGGIDLLLEAMRRFPTNAALQASACLAIGQLGSSELRAKRRAKEGGVVVLVLKVLSQHPQQAVAQRWACAALRHLASNSQELKSSIAKRGGVEALCDSGRRFLASERKVTAESLGALCHLASKHAANKRRIFEAGALELALEAMQAPGAGSEAAAPCHADAELAMASCGLLHNLGCDDAIKRHIVKLGGREEAQKLESHSAVAVQTLARMLGRTLAPAADISNDPFGSIFSTRTPGLTAARRATSRRGRKNAQAALRAVRPEDGETIAANQKAEAEERARRQQRRKEKGGYFKGGDPDDDGTVSVTSVRSGGSSGSASSSSGSNRGGARRFPGQSKEITSARRFSAHWDGQEPTEESLPSQTRLDGNQSPKSAKESRAASRSGQVSSRGSRSSETDDDVCSVASSNGSSAGSASSDAMSLLSLDAGVSNAELSATLEAMGGIRVRRGDAQESKRNEKVRSVADRLHQTVSRLEEAAKRSLDGAGNAAKVFSNVTAGYSPAVKQKSNKKSIPDSV